MKSRVFTAVLALVFLFAALLVVGPVLSGEHPWDSDRGGDGDGDGERDIFYKGDTTPVIKDTTIIAETDDGFTTSTESLLGFFTGAIIGASLSL
jgi:hypothetical protein